MSKPHNPRLIGDGDTFTAISNAFIEYCKVFNLTHKARLVYEHLKYRTGANKDTAYPSIDDFMAYTRLGKKSVRDGIKELEAHGWITVKRISGESNIYTLTHPSAFLSKIAAEGAEHATTTGNRTTEAMHNATTTDDRTTEAGQSVTTTPIKNDRTTPIKNDRTTPIKNDTLTRRIKQEESNNNKTAALSRVVVVDSFNEKEREIENHLRGKRIYANKETEQVIRTFAAFDDMAGAKECIDREYEIGVKSGAREGGIIRRLQCVTKENYRVGTKEIERAGEVVTFDYSTLGAAWN